MSKPVITVFGATGAQGGGLARAILGDPQQRFALRAVTRNPNGDAARELARRGAQLAVADLDDACSVARALDGAHGAFCLTNFWEHFSPEKELAQAYTLASAAAPAGVRHVIWSTLEDTRQYFAADGARMPVLHGKYNVPHFDAKGEANRFFEQQGVPTTLLRTSFYWDNFIHFGLGPKPDAQGLLTLALPLANEKMPGIAVEDIGKAAFGIFAQGDTLIGSLVGIAGEHLSGAQMAAQLQTALARPVRYRAVTPGEFRAGGFPGADDLGNMFQFKQEFAAQFCAARNVAATRTLNPKLQNFAQWLQQNGARIPL
jgi:uncharacterized protein YbjT (DUF2867 family)